MTVLHIDSSARIEASNSRILSQYLVEALGEVVIRRDLAQQPLPAISAEDLVAVHGSLDQHRDSLAAQLTVSEELINELKQSNTLVLGVPMYNFGVPASLKQWIDAICRAGVSFKYTAEGPQGLLGVDRAIIITATGGTPVGSEMDFVTPYLQHICHFLGINDVYVIDASGSKREPEQIIAQGKAQIDKVVAQIQTA